MTPLKVLQVGVRLSEGGAAGVMRTLHEELPELGATSHLVYGYGPHGHDSPAADSLDALRITPMAIAGVNRLNYGLLGRDTHLKSPTGWRRFSERIERADVVHLHVLHSYFASLQDLFALIAEHKKPTVWTMHDQWALTGRCAQPGPCRLWESGCPTCPNLAAYPPALLDQAAKRHVDKREAILRFAARVPLAIVSCAHWLAEECRRAHLPNVSVVHNSVDREFWQASHTAARKPRRANNVFYCRNLKDTGKVDWPFLSQVAEYDSLTVIGDNPPGVLPKATLVPAITNRRKLARQLATHKRLIFTSTVDYYPLTLAEGITAGLEIYAIDSPAAQEFSHLKEVRLFQSTRHMLAELRSNRSEERRSSNSEHFAPSRMASEYLDVYKTVSEHRSA